MIATIIPEKKMHYPVMLNEVNETKEEEDDLEIPAFLRRQKN